MICTFGFRVRCFFQGRHRHVRCPQGYTSGGNRSSSGSYREKDVSSGTGIGVGCTGGSISGSDRGKDVSDGTGSTSGSDRGKDVIVGTRICVGCTGGSISGSDRGKDVSGGTGSTGCRERSRYSTSYNDGGRNIGGDGRSGSSRSETMSDGRRGSTHKHGMMLGQRIFVFLVVDIGHQGFVLDEPCRRRFGTINLSFGIVQYFKAMLHRTKHSLVL